MENEARDYYDNVLPYCTNEELIDRLVWYVQHFPTSDCEAFDCTRAEILTRMEGK